MPSGMGVSSFVIIRVLSYVGGCVGVVVVVVVD